METKRIDLGYRPRAKQAEIHRKRRRFTVAVAHRRFGKTIVAVMELVDAALTIQREDGRFGYVAPYRNQAKAIVWDYLKRYTAPIPGTTFNETELSVDLPNGSRVRLFGADNADSMRGLYFDGVVLDEVADMKPHVWGEIVRPALADRKGWAMFIGTPKGIDAFYEHFINATEGFRNEAGERVKNDDWYGVVYTVDDTDVLDERELADARSTMSEAQYRQEFYCDFSASCDNVLITIDMVSDAIKRKVTERDLYGAPKVLGVDVARFGDDRSSIVRRHGLCAFQPKIFRGVDNMELVGHVAQEIRDFKPDAVFIDAGRGEGVIDRLRQLGYPNIIEVNFGGKPTAGGAYVNRRSEMWDKMRLWLQAGGCLPDCAELRKDLVIPTYSFDAAGRLVLEPKDKIKERGLPSTDVGDGIALTFAEEVNVAHRDMPQFADATTMKLKRDDNPFARSH